MASCDAIRPLLVKVVEREVNPREAMRAARHLADCTGCKILLARERRLAKMLEVDLQDIPVGEDFFQSVMASLPEEPPPAPPGDKTKRNRHGLKLAMLIGLIGASAMLAARTGWLAGGSGPLAALPPTDLEATHGSFEGLADLARIALVALEGISGGIGLDNSLLAGNLGLLGGAATVVLLLLGAGSAFVALAARCLVWLKS